MHFEYLIFLLLILFSSIIGIFLYKKSKIPDFKKYTISTLAVNIPYLIWDQIVTDHWWWFNQKYTIGVKIFKLPLEEILFFFVVPWSCLVLWVNIKGKIKEKINFPIEDALLLTSLLFCFWAYLNSKWYSFATSIGLIIVSFLGRISKDFLRKKNLIFFLLIVFFLILIFNGYLTFRPIVLYDQNFLSSIYFFTIPIEDVIYGLVMIIAIVFIYEKLKYNTI